MKLPLFVHTSPVPSDSCVVSVPAGEWLVELNHKDAALNLSVGFGDEQMLYETIQDGQKLIIPKSSLVRATIVKKGTEPHISLYLNEHKSHSAEE